MVIIVISVGSFYDRICTAEILNFVTVLLLTAYRTFL